MRSAMTAFAVQRSSMALVVSAIFLAAATAATAQEVKRTELKRADLTGTNMEVITAVLEAPPGAAIPRHFHHGEESFYVLQGATIETPQGKSQLETGASGINRREVPHAGYKVVGDTTLKLLTTHIVDKGKPLSVAVGQ
jgi:quercetin dioxygenase-like cupin family protein